MAKFKVGDRVKIKKASMRRGATSRYGTIEYPFDSTSFFVKMDDPKVLILETYYIDEFKKVKE